jgi:putative transposase
LARRPEFALPDGWVACGWRFEVETTSPQQRSLIQQHFGARRFAYNWALAIVKANLDARAADPSVPLLAWTLPTLRKAWNQAKVTVAPWWPSCSKEAYACGIADLTIALQNWSASKHSHRGGRKVGFPRFKARHRDRGRVRFSTGAMRLESDRRHLTLPVVGRLRSKESTRRLERKVARGQARVLSMTLSEHAGRLFVSVATIVVLVPRSPREPNARCGIDLGVGTEWAVIAHADGTVERVPHPVQWASAQKQHRRLARRASRRTVGSRGHRQAKTKLAALDRRAANLRRESIHTLTTRLTRQYGTIVVEDLDIAAMARGMGRRAFRRSVHAAGLGQIRPTMAYKSAWGGCALVVADRWFASSKIHHECGGYHADLKLADRRWVCPRCGGLVDRNANAARNLRDWTGPVTDRGVQRGGVAAPVPIVGDHDGQAHAAAWACEASEDHRAVAEADDTRTEPHPGARNPAQGCQERSDTDAR